MMRDTAFHTAWHKHALVCILNIAPVIQDIVAIGFNRISWTCFIFQQNFHGFFKKLLIVIFTGTA